MTTAYHATAHPQADGDPRPTSAVPRAINPVTFTGLAAVLDKVRCLQLGHPVRPWSSASPEDQDALLRDAAAAIHAQDPSRARRAYDLALERAEAVLREEGAIESDQARALARRIAAEALLTHRLALQGAFDRQGGVQ